MKRCWVPFDLFLRRFVGRRGQRFARRKMAGYLLEDVDLSAPRFIPNLSGCFMFVRMEALQRVGLFDERFFLYMEDVGPVPTDRRAMGDSLRSLRLRRA